jgi:hypothetical protein
MTMQTEDILSCSQEQSERALLRKECSCSCMLEYMASLLKRGLDTTVKLASTETNKL